MNNKRVIVRTGAVVAALSLAVVTAGCSSSNSGTTSDTITIGLLSTTEGPFTVLGEAANRGAKLALTEYGGTLDGIGALDGVTGATVAGKNIEIVIESSDASPDSAVAAATRLVEKDKVDILVGPLSGDEGLAIKDYAKKHPDVTFVNGSSGAQNTTLRDPAANFFRFGTDGAQWSAGLGAYSYENLGVKTVATLGEDYSFPYDQVGGFMTEFCAAGGKVPSKVWVPIGTKDFSSFISQIPTTVDAIFVALGGADVVNFTKQIDQSALAGKKIIGGTISVDPSVIEGLGSRAEGIVSAGPVAALDTTEYSDYAAAYTKNFPEAGNPGLFDVEYYIAMKSVLLGIEQVKGNLGAKEADLNKALTALTWTTPIGPVALDENRQAIANNYLFQITNGQNALLDTVSNVNQTLGFPAKEYIAQPAFDRDNPSCK